MDRCITILKATQQLGLTREEGSLLEPFIQPSSTSLHQLLLSRH